MILVWSFKFFKDFYSHHDAGCHDNQKEKKNFGYLIVKSKLAYFKKLVSKRVLHIPHGEGPLLRRHQTWT